MGMTLQGWAVLSKCANPECSQQFRYLHSGKLFCLTPTPEIEAIGGVIPKLSERFWLCERCSKTMTLVWVGTHAQVVALPAGAGETAGVLSAKAALTERRRAASRSR